MMQRVSTIVFMVGILSFLSLGGCKGDPCTKIGDRAKKCYLKEKGKVKLEGGEQNQYAKLVEICRLDSSKFAKCLNKKGCDAFKACVSQAGTQPDAVKEYNNQLKENTETSAPAMAAPAMAAPAMAAPAMTAPPKNKDNAKNKK